jgi:hypothetical protein
MNSIFLYIFIFSVNFIMKNNIFHSISYLTLFSCQKKEEAPVTIDSNKLKNTKKALFWSFGSCIRLGCQSDIINWQCFGGFDSVNKKATGLWCMPNWILEHYPLENLSINNIIDFYMIQNHRCHFLLKLKSYEWNPAEYNTVCGACRNIKWKIRFFRKCVSTVWSGARKRESVSR